MLCPECSSMLQPGQPLCTACGARSPLANAAPVMASVPPPTSTDSPTPAPAPTAQPEPDPISEPTVAMPAWTPEASALNSPDRAAAASSSAAGASSNFSAQSTPSSAAIPASLPASSGSGRSRVGMAVGVVVLLAVVAGIGFVAGGDSSTDDTQTAVGDFDERDDVRTYTDDTGVATDDSAPSATATTVGVTAPATAPGTPAGGGPAFGTWIAQLESVEVGAGQERLDSVMAVVRQSVPDALVLQSDAYASMRPGYFVIYHPGPFFSGLDAVGFCDNRRLAMPSHCLGRLLTSNPADLESSQCYRTSSGLTPGCGQ